MNNVNAENVTRRVHRDAAAECDRLGFDAETLTVHNVHCSSFQPEQADRSGLCLLRFDATVERDERTAGLYGMVLHRIEFGEAVADRIELFDSPDRRQMEVAKLTFRLMRFSWKQTATWLALGSLLLVCGVVAAALQTAYLPIQFSRYLYRKWKSK